MKTHLNSIRSGIRVQMATFAISLFTAVAAIQALPAEGQTSKKPVNVNTADLATLETLPGVTPTVAQHIVDGRPYKSMDDLSKVKGLSKTKVKALQGHVTFGSTKAAANGSSKSASTTESKKSATASSGKVNVNTADRATLETLPGVSSTTAQNIIDGRPFTSYSQLEQVQGLSKTKVESMRSHLTLGSTTAATSHSKKSKSGTTTANQGGTTENPSTESETARSESSKNQNQNALTPTGRSSSGKLAPGETVNINTATADELDKLYGIGPSKAQAIIDYRNQHGDFQSIDDIMKVNGIKEGEFNKIKDNITVR